MSSSISARNVTITWSPPPAIDINGEIQSYVVSYYPSSDMAEESVTPDMTMYTAEGLMPYTNYTFSVLAVTVDRGPAAMVDVLTLEAGKN